MSDIITQSVIAEDAPIGVQLWPTISPEFAPNFTLEEVQIIRNGYGKAVRWIYENGNERLFRLGESVAVQYPEGYQPTRLHHCGSTVQERPASGWDDADMAEFDSFCPRCSVFTNRVS